MEKTMVKSRAKTQRKKHNPKIHVKRGKVKMARHRNENALDWRTSTASQFLCENLGDVFDGAPMPETITTAKRERGTPIGEALANELAELL